MKADAKNALGQHLIIGLRGPALEADEIDFIVRNNIGGVILFARNCLSPPQVHALCSEVQALRGRMPDKAPLWIGVDNEGGRVARLKPPFTQWPAPAELGKVDSTSVAFKFAAQMGEELRAVGINVCFAPSADVLTNPNNPAIGDRSFGPDPELVARMASAVVRGFMKSDVLPCVKHFPGHGNTAVDSHFTLPVETRTLIELRARELVPFKKTLHARLDLVMTAHILFPNVDPVWPASLSPVFAGLLREELRFRGLIVTDDLGMKALADRWSVANVAVQAMKAGADLLLYCNEPEAPGIALEALRKALSEKSLDASLLKTSLQRIFTLKRAKLIKPDPLPFEQTSEAIGHADHSRLAQAIASGSVSEELAPRNN